MCLLPLFGIWVFSGLCEAGRGRGSNGMCLGMGFRGLAGALNVCVVLTAGWCAMWYG